MKIVMDGYNDYLFIVRVLTSSAHEPYNLKRIIKGIDDSALNFDASISEIASEFTLTEIIELKESTEKLLKLAYEKDFDSLSTLMDGYNFLFCDIYKCKNNKGILNLLVYEAG